MVDLCVALEGISKILCRTPDVFIADACGYEQMSQRNILISALLQGSTPTPHTSHKPITNTRDLAGNILTLQEPLALIQLDFRNFAPEFVAHNFCEGIEILPASKEKLDRAGSCREWLLPFPHPANPAEVRRSGNSIYWPKILAYF
jgi:hypothetical protein